MFMDDAVTNPRPMPEEIRVWGYLAYKTRDERHAIMEMDASKRARIIDSLKRQVDARRVAR